MAALNLVVAARRGLAYPRARRVQLVGDESEHHFMGRVRKLARLYGWVDWHQHDSIGTRAGLPDLILVRPPRLIFAELKSQHGPTRPPQRKALALLGQCPAAETYLWKPSDWGSIVSILR